MRDEQEIEKMIEETIEQIKEMRKICKRTFNNGMKIYMLSDKIQILKWVLEDDEDDF